MRHPDMGWGRSGDSSSCVVSGRPWAIINYTYMLVTQLRVRPGHFILRY